MANLKSRRTEVPVRRSVFDWPTWFTDWERDFFSPFFALASRAAEGMTPQTWAPRVDIIEKPDQWVFRAEIPDVDPKDIQVTVEEGVLMIRGERKFEEEVKEGNFTRIEREYGAFERRFSLPSGIDLDKISAEYKNGVLNISISKKEEARPKSIQINVQ